MHIPDGFLSPPVTAAAWFASAVGIGYGLKKASEKMRDRAVPLMGVMAAFLFAAQMVNFPVAGGTSGHLIGGVLAAVLLGPFTGSVVLACVLVFQCLIFQDGGLTALGANILNMALAGTFGGYLLYSAARKIFSGESGIIISSAIAAWLSVILGSAMCAFELAFSGLTPLHLVFPAMIGVHALIGLGEAVITAAVISFVLKTRPDLVYCQIPELK